MDLAFVKDARKTRRAAVTATRNEMLPAAGAARMAMETAPYVAARAAHANYLPKGGAKPISTLGR